MPPARYVLASELGPLTLEVDESVSEVHAAKYVQKLFILHPGVTELLVAAAVVAHLFSAFEAAGVRPRLVMYLVGPSMVGKTTLAQLIGQAYNRSATDDPQLVSLVSTTAAVHHRVSALSDCVCIVDDLYPSSSLAETRRREERIGEIIRTTGNGTPKEKLTGNQITPEISRGVVFATAEYALTSFSTVARVVSLPMTNSIERQRLTAFQQNPKMLSTFWFYFLRWASRHYNELVNFIASRFAALREGGATETGLDRGMDAHQILAIGVKILADYVLCVSGSKEKAVEQPQKMQKWFQNAAQKSYVRQKRELRLLQRSTETDRFSKFVAKLCFSGQIADGKKKKLGPDCSALIAKDTLYIQGEHLARAARKFFNDRSLTLQCITAELRSNGLLEMDKSNRSSKKVNGVRYLQIPLSRLEEFSLPPQSSPLTMGALGLDPAILRSISKDKRISFSGRWPNESPEK